MGKYLVYESNKLLNIIENYKVATQHELLDRQTAFKILPQMSRIMRKPTFCICENKDADQLRGNREAD